MKYEEIQEMLDRYWEGETSLEEERRIKAYFNAGAVDERLRAIEPMFQALREEQTVQLASKAKAATLRPQMYQWAVAASLALLLTAGWCMFKTEKASGPADPVADKIPTELPKSIEQQVVETQQKTLALREEMVSNPVLPKKKNLPKRLKPTPSIDPETAQAMEEIKAALSLVSAKLDKGRNQAIKGAMHLEAMEKVPKRKEG